MPPYTAALLLPLLPRMHLYLPLLPYLPPPSCAGAKHRDGERAGGADGQATLNQWLADDVNSTAVWRE